jgi:hypothetical protein
MCRWLPYTRREAAAVPLREPRLTLDPLGASRERRRIVLARRDGGHGKLPTGGHRKSPLMATGCPHGRPRISPLLLS